MFLRAIRKIKRPQVVQAIADGAANTFGTVMVYGVILLIIFAWYHGRKAKQQATRGGSADPLYNALMFSKPAAAAHKMNLVLNAESPSTATTDMWV